MLRWWRARRARGASHDRFIHDLVLEHAERVARGDEDAMEASRGLGYVGGPEAYAMAGLRLYMVLLVATVVPLVGLFWLIEQWVG